MPFLDIWDYGVFKLAQVSSFGGPFRRPESALRRYAAGVRMRHGLAHRAISAFSTEAYIIYSDCAKGLGRLEITLNALACQSEGPDIRSTPLY
jgi:hypothetical protein